MIKEVEGGQMKIRMVATDLDGTLLTSEKKILEKTIGVLKKIQEQGISLLLVSGRPLASMYDFGEQVDCRALIGMNGGQLFDRKSQTMLLKKTMEKDLSLSFYRAWKSPKIFSIFYGEKTMYSNRKYREESQETKKSLSLAQDGKHMKLVEVEDLADCHEDIYKICMVGRPEDLQKEEEEIRKKFQDYLQIAYSSPYFLEATPKGVDKGITLDYFAQLEKIHPREIIAFGDSENDLPMLRYAGRSCAVKEASQKVKDQVDLLIASNDDQGVCKYLEELFLL